MAKEQISVQEMEDFSLLLSNLLVRDAWPNHSVSSHELEDTIQQTATRINEMFSYNGSASAIGGDARGRHYTPADNTERKLVQNAQIRIGHSHVSAHDCSYYLVSIVTKIAFRSAIDSMHLPTSTNGLARLFADKFSDHLARTWGKRFGLVRIPDEQMPIVCAAITLSCGNPFGIASNAKPFSVHDVVKLLDNKGFFLSDDVIAAEPQLLPHAFLPVYDAQSDATATQKLQLMQQLSDLVTFEHWPSPVPPTDKDLYVRGVLESLINAGLLERPHSSSTDSVPHDSSTYIYCL